MGDYVWFDDNYNGVQEVTELPVEGVKVCALNFDGTPYEDGAGVQPCDDTDSQGKYFIGNLPPDKSYCVQFDLATLPDGYLVTKQNIGVDSLDSDPDKLTGIACETIPPMPSGNHDPTLDLGIVHRVCMGNYAWHDTDIDGIQDPDEQPIPGVVAKLIDQNGADTGIWDTTGADGHYHICALPGTYRIIFVLPPDGRVTNPDLGGNDETDSDVDRLTQATTLFNLVAGAVDDLRWDIGIYFPTASGEDDEPAANKRLYIPMLSR